MTHNRNNGSNSRLIDLESDDQYSGNRFGRNSSNSNSKSVEEEEDAVGPELKGQALTDFLNEMEGENAEIDDIQSLNDLIIHPLPGSLIMVFKDPMKRTKNHVVKFATDSFVPNLVPILFSDDVPMEMYVIFRIVLPHKKAVAVAEKIGVLAKQHNIPVTQVLAQISGMDIKNRSDLKQILVKVMNYHPHIATVLKSFFTKMNIVST